MRALSLLGAPAALNPQKSSLPLERKLDCPRPASWVKGVLLGPVETSGKGHSAPPSAVPKPSFNAGT